MKLHRLLNVVNTEYYSWLQCYTEQNEIEHGRKEDSKE